MEAVIRQRFGAHGLRVFRLLLLHPQLEQKQIAEKAMLPPKVAFHSVHSVSCLTQASVITNAHGSLIIPSEDKEHKIFCTSATCLPCECQSCQGRSTQCDAFVCVMLGHETRTCVASLWCVHLPVAHAVLPAGCTNSSSRQQRANCTSMQNNALNAFLSRQCFV